MSDQLSPCLLSALGHSFFIGLHILAGIPPAPPTFSLCLPSLEPGDLHNTHHLGMHFSHQKSLINTYSAHKLAFILEDLHACVVYECMCVYICSKGGQRTCVCVCV